MLIREYRILAGLSQARLAARVGLSQGDISRIERGLRSITVEQLVVFAHALDVTPAQLLDPPVGLAA